MTIFGVIGADTYALIQIGNSSVAAAGSAGPPFPVAWNGRRSSRFLVLHSGIAGTASTATTRCTAAAGSAASTGGAATSPGGGAGVAGILEKFGFIGTTADKQ